MLSDNLMLLRSYKKVSQEEVAGILGISRQAYAKWENGKTLPDIEKMARLAAYYDTTIDNIYNYNTKQANITVPPAPKGKHIFGTTVINDRGQILIPKNARDILDFKKGDTLILLGDEGEGLAIMKADLFESKLNKLLEMTKSETKDKA